MKDGEEKWVEQTPPASILASGIGVLSISTWLDQIIQSRLEMVVYGRDGGESKCPATNFTGIAVDSNRVDRLVEKSVLASTIRKSYQKG